MTDLELLRLELAFAKASEAGAHRMEQFHSDYADLWHFIATTYRDCIPEGALHEAARAHIAERIKEFQDKHL